MNKLLPRNSNTKRHCDVCMVPLPRDHKLNVDGYRLCKHHNPVVHRVMLLQHVGYALAVKAVRLGLRFPSARVFQGEINKAVYVFTGRRDFDF